MGSKGILESHRHFAAGSGTSAVQRAQDAMDLGELSDVTLLVYVEIACASGTLYLQSAPEQAEVLFANVSGVSVSLGTRGAFLLQLSSFSRYVRWKLDNPSNNQCQLSIEVFGRTPGE